MQRFLAQCCGHEFEPLFVTLSATGMRIGEALGVSWKRVDLEAGTLRVEQVLYRTPLASRIDGEVYALGEPKTEKSRRTLVLPAGRWPYCGGIAPRPWNVGSVRTCG